jgi:hypothetical protein
VWNYCLTGLKAELNAVQLYRNYIGLERQPVRDATDLRIGIRV